MANGLIQLIIDIGMFLHCFIISIVLCVFDINYKSFHRSVGENDYRWKHYIIKACQKGPQNHLSHNSCYIHEYKAFLREGEVFSPLSMGYTVFEVWLRRIRRLECWVCPHPLPTPWRWWIAWISSDSIARVVFPASHCSYRAFSSLLQVFAFFWPGSTALLPHSLCRSTYLVLPSPDSLLSQNHRMCFRKCPQQRI